MFAAGLLGKVGLITGVNNLRSQHQRNLNRRGCGFDERVLRINRQIAESLGLHGQYAEAFELENYG
jgi:hypothetical protein